jgi:hypothetical protein
MTNSQLMDYMVSLHFINFISWGVLDNGPHMIIIVYGYGYSILTFHDMIRDEIMGF